MTTDEAIILNEKRNEKFRQPYNQKTGKGCNGNRVRFEIKDAPFKILYLPEEMFEENIVVELQNTGSIKEYLKKKLKTKTITKAQFVNFWIAFCELRYKYDFEFYAITCITIRDKLTGLDIAFRLNFPQRILLKELEKMRINNVPIRLNYLKSRQFGGSTLIQMYMNYIQVIHRQNWNSTIVAHVKDAAITIRTMYERSLEKMILIEGKKNHLKNFGRTQNIKYIPERGCTITVGTAIEPDSVRSQDVKMVHFSEVSKYPNTQNNSAELLEMSIISSVPDVPYTMIVRETTAGGLDYFYEQWQKAAKGDTIYQNCFVSCSAMEIYAAEFDNYYYLHNGHKRSGTVKNFVKTLTDYEQNIFKNNEHCTLEHLNWRRMKAATMPSEMSMKQEFPEDSIEAFQDSGMPAFRSEDVERQRQHCIVPAAIGELQAELNPKLANIEKNRRKDILKNIKFFDDKQLLQECKDAGESKTRERKERNKLRIWKFPDIETKVSNRYLVTFDPQRGLSESADYGVIKVIDRYWKIYNGKSEIVAMWRGRLDKDITMWIAVQIAKYYNNALLVVERNTYDTDNGKEDWAKNIFGIISEFYHNIYCDTPEDTIIDESEKKYGFHTNSSSKPAIITNYISLLRENGYIERDNETLNEARTFEQKKNGKFGAKPKMHDDCIMATMIGLYVDVEKMPLPKLIKESERQITTPKINSLASI
ncbi:MAG: hypothetical protein LBS69_04020 [Prevotellaceae bacterium]|jgi:hypothetical protein|nr:hypothetical protein [Prevotellaceae bacterium]